MEAFVVLNTHPEIFPAIVVAQRGLQSAARVFYEHQVFPVETSKFLLVFSLHSALHRCFKGPST